MNQKEHNLKVGQIVTLTRNRDTVDYLNQLRNAENEVWEIAGFPEKTYKWERTRYAIVRGKHSGLEVKVPILTLMLDNLKMPLSIQKVGPNQTEVAVQQGKKQVIVFFSYKTPVAALVRTARKLRLLISREKFSQTTSGHLYAWRSRFDTEKGVKEERVEQRVINALFQI